MARMKGICRNEECEMCDKIQEAEKSNFKCEMCGKDLIPFGNKTIQTGGLNKKLLGIIVGSIALLAIIGGIIFFSIGGNENKTSQDTTNVLPVDSDSIATVLTPKQEEIDNVLVDSDSVKAAQMEEENRRLKDSISALQVVNDNSIKKEATVEKQSAPSVPKPKASSGTKNLGYATFKGNLKNGVPDDVNGRLVFNSSHVIDSKDPKGRVAEPGDYVIGEFSEGHLVQGIWYGADNVVKGSIIIGK